MIQVGLTGGIGSGKTIVSKIFEKLGVPVFNSDEKAKELTATDPEIKEKIILRFGKGIFTSEGLDRKKLASIVFSDPIALAGLNYIIHPAVRNSFELWLSENASAPYVIREAAILFETGAYKECDKLITVFAPEEIRIERVMKRDGVSAEDVKKRILNQASDDYRMKLSDFIIFNDNSKLVIPQVLRVNDSLIR
jgi:dephospho-CoA kinase